MSLFETDDPNAHIGYRNLRAAEFPVEAEVRSGLEALWRRYEPYADGNFRKEFSMQPDTRFWEMYLTVRLADAGKKVRKRAEVPAATRDIGPDICILKGRRKIWIEAISPDQGDVEKNLDRVPDLPQEEGRVDVAAQRRAVELRITSALDTKITKFQIYRNSGIIAEINSCIIAISAGRFPLQAIHFGLPPAVTAVYPFGEEHHTFDPNSRRFSRVFDFSPEIPRRRGDAIARRAFQDAGNAGISGLIWSLRSIGNFLGQPDDFTYVQCQVGARPVPRRWIKWAEAYFTIDEGRRLWATKTRTSGKTFKVASGFA